MSIGKNIKEMRLARGWTQKQLGELCGMADSAIRRYEADRGNPTLSTLKKFADAFGVEISTLQNDFHLINNEFYDNSVDEDRINVYYEQLSIAFYKLNYEGQEKMLDYALLLATHPKYQRTQDETATKPIDTPLNSKKPPEGE